MIKPAVSPFVVSFAVSLAAFMEVLDTTIANVALSHIAGSLGATYDESTWVLTSYLVSNGIVLPISGWLSGLIGRKNYFIACILGFTLTSFLCGIATSLTMLILCRLFQGLAGGGLQPTQQAIIKDSFPPEKLGMALAVTSITTVLAPVLGPVLGGYITDNFSWRWIFFINVPAGLLAAFLVKELVEDPPSAQKQKVGSIDYIGLSLIALGLGTLQIVLDKGQQEDWLDSSFILCFAAISAVSLLFAILWISQQKNPIVQLKLFANSRFSVPCLMIFFVGVALYTSTMMLPLLVQTVYNYDATLAGLVLSPSGIATIVMMPVAGKLVSKVQGKYLVSLGMLITALGMWLNGLLTPDTDFKFFMFVRIIQTLSIPLLLVPASTLAFSSVSAKDSSNASAIITLMRNLGGSVGISLATSLLASNRQIEQANLAQHLTAADPGYQSALSGYLQTIMNLGIPYEQAAKYTLGKIYQELLRQAGLLAFRDVYNFIAAVLVVLGVIALFMPGNKEQKSA